MPQFAQLANRIAIDLIEHLGNHEPTQEQIDLVEYLIIQSGCVFLLSDNLADSS